jgi:hypothetical protein
VRSVVTRPGRSGREISYIYEPTCNPLHVLHDLACQTNTYVRLNCTVKADHSVNVGSSIDSLPQKFPVTCQLNHKIAKSETGSLRCGSWINANRPGGQGMGQQSAARTTCTCIWAMQRDPLAPSSRGLLMYCPVACRFKPPQSSHHFPIHRLRLDLGAEKE